MGSATARMKLTVRIAIMIVYRRVRARRSSSTLIGAEVTTAGS